MSYAKELGHATGHLIGTATGGFLSMWFSSGKHGWPLAVIGIMMLMGVWYMVGPLIDVLTKPIRRAVWRWLVQDQHEGGSNG